MILVTGLEGTIFTMELLRKILGSSIVEIVTPNPLTKFITIDLNIHYVGVGLYSPSFRNHTTRLWVLHQTKMGEMGGCST